MIKVGIIGTGKHGSRYANHVVNDLPELELSAISRSSDIGAEQASKWQTRWFPEWEDLVQDPDVDAVISVVPPHLNLAISRACARTGKPLLIEKPMGINGFVSQQIVSLMATAKCPLTVGQTLRYNPVISRLKEELLGMGDIYSIHVNQRIEPSTLPWHDQKDIAGAGVLIHTAVHVFDALFFMTGQKVIRVFASTYKHHNKVLEDLVTLLFEMEGNIAGTVDVSKVGPARSGRLEFICSEGQLQGEQIYGYIEKTRNNQVEKIATFEPTGTIAPLLEDWSRFLCNKGKNPVSGEEGRYAVEVCDACLKSAEKEEWVGI